MVVLLPLAPHSFKVAHQIKQLLKLFQEACPGIEIFLPTFTQDIPQNLQNLFRDILYNIVPKYVLRSKF